MEQIKIRTKITKKWVKIGSFEFYVLDNWLKYSKWNQRELIDVA
jgi:hypothetical protein